MKRSVNRNLAFLMDCYEAGLSGVVLEGSSRSGKSFAAIDFIIYLCQFEPPMVVNVIKETYNSFKTTLYDDFSKRLDDYGLDNPFTRSKEVSTFKIYNHKINFLGADNPAKFHGASADFVWFNEGLDISNDIFDQAEMRCRKFWFMDYNPKVTLHYVYDRIIPRDDVGYLKSTFRDNPFISKQELNKILSYEPTAYNIRQGTADDYMWQVYGLGNRMAQTGLVFRNVTWVDSFPDNVERIGYGMDFGYTHDPTALVKVGVNGNDMFIELLIYQPTENAATLAPLLRATTQDAIIWADSADPVMISDLSQTGLRVFAIKKFSGSIKYGIGLIKSYNVHLVKNHNLQREQENYTWRTINGISLDEPVDDFNHAWDAVRYCVMANFRRNDTN